MSRRKQLKPMHIRNERADIIHISSMNSLNGKESTYEEQGSSDVTNLENCSKTKDTASSNGVISLLDPLLNTTETPKNSILADFSCLIPKDDDELLQRKNDRKENYLDQEAILRQFVANQIRKTGRYVGRISRGRGRGKGRGRGRGRGRGADVYGRMNQSINNVHLNADGSLDDDKIMRCRICSKPFKRQWSLQVHELIHHQARDSIPENLALTLAPSDRRRLDAENMKEKMNSLKKNRDEINLGNWSQKNTISENQNSKMKEPDCKLINNCDNTIQNKIYASLSPDLNSDAEENNNETTSQSSETGSLSADICITEHIAALQHTPMFGGITIPSITNFRELRRQVSLARRTCKYCGKVCFKPSDLQRHLMKHTGERPFSCSECGRKFKAKRSLHYHQRASHGAIIELSPALEDKFAQTKKYQKMMLQGSNGSNLSDVGNDHSSLDSNDVAERMMPNNKDCNQSSAKLESHLSDDNDELSSGLTDSGEEDKELEIKNQKNDNTKNIAVQMQTQPPLLEKNVNNADVECDNDCENHVPSSEKLNADVSAIIPAVPTESEDNLTDEKTNFVPVTSEKDSEKHPFFNRYKINFRSEEIIASRLEGINSITGEKVFLYKCHLCGKIYSVMSKLQNHLTVHMKRNKKQYSCTHCDEVFKFRSQWILHSRTHKIDLQSSAASQEIIVNGSNFESPTKFQEEESETHLLDEKVVDSLPLTSVQNNNSVTDSICNATPPIISAINAVSLYQGNPVLLSPDNDLIYPYDFKSKFKQNYNCRYCGKYFDRPFSLQRHERMHTGIKPCYCKDCGRGFSEPRNLRHHIIRFHSDGSLHHLLRRNRCKNDTPLKTHPHTRILPFGNFSLLKKNAENFLNNSTSNILKLDDTDDDNTPPTLEEMVPLNPQSQTLLDYKPPFIDVNQNNDSFSTYSPTTAQEEENNEEKVTIVIPTEVDNLQNQNSPFYDSELWARQDMQQTNCLSSIDRKEILTDPKRSLIGNRRKQRPHKLTVDQTIVSVENTISPNPDENVNNKEQNLKVNELLKNFQSNSHIEKRNEAKNLKSNREEHWQTRMTVASLLARQRGIEIQPRKGRPKNRKAVVGNNTSKLQKPEKSTIESSGVQGENLSNGNMIFACCFCNKSFSSATDLSSHMIFHKADVKPDSKLISKVHFMPMYENFSSSDIKVDFSNGSQRR